MSVNCSRAAEASRMVYKQGDDVQGGKVPSREGHGTVHGHEDAICEPFLGYANLGSSLHE
jgi:hypothetical protein